MCSYDVFGNRADMERLSPSGAVTEQSMYSYDKNNRLLDILTTEYNGAVRHTQYTYDANGNRTMQVQSGTTPAPMYMGASVRAGETGTGMTTYRYDLLGRMTGMQNDSATAGYTYDGNGLRQSKNVNGRTTAYVYDGVNIIKEGDTYYSRGVSGLISAGENYYYTDYHGSVVRYGNSVYSYDAFGNEKSENTNDSNPFRYCGEYADSESGLIYLRARYYDSVIGAFVSEDPAKDGLNWYVYCSNNPVNLIDPFGLFDYNTRLSYNQTYNEDVEVLQNELVWLGYLDMSGGGWGYFGRKTQDAVNRYKKDMGLGNTGKDRGIVGLETWTSLGLIHRTENDISVGVEIVMARNINAGGRKQYKDYTNPIGTALLNAQMEFGMNRRKSGWFAKKVCNQGPWNVKRNKKIWESTLGVSYPGSAKIVLCGELVGAEEVGNITYGYLGKAAGFENHEIYAGSMFNQLYTHGFNDWNNEFTDHRMIQKGIDWWDRGIGIGR